MSISLHQWKIQKEQPERVGEDQAGFPNVIGVRDIHTARRWERLDPAVQQIKQEIFEHGPVSFLDHVILNEASPACIASSA